MSAIEVQNAAPAKRKSGYLPTLDGWRAIAILLVLVFHDKVHGHGIFSTRIVAHFGLYGVYLFFGISGLLICTRLLEEEKITGGLHLPGFYIRRVLRIQPPALLLLATVGALMAAGLLPKAWPSLVDALLLVRNYLPVNHNGDAFYSTAHFWSLSVEEHFYLILPAFLVLIKRHRARVLLAATAVALAWTTYRGIVNHSFEVGAFQTDRCIFFLLFPSAIAVLLQRSTVRSALERYLRPIPVIILASLALAALGVGNPLSCVLPTAMILSTLLHPRSLAGKLLESAPMRYIGRISFGLYLWQQLFLTGRWAPNLHTFGAFQNFPLNWLATFGLATASFYLLEKPCMRLGHRLARPALDGRPELAPGPPPTPLHARDVVAEQPTG